MLSMHALSAELFVTMLGDLTNILDKAADHARSENIDPATLTSARLAPDMFDLTKQVQVACDQAKNSVAKLTGGEAPAFEDNEKTLDELKARIARTVDYIKGVDAKAFEGSDSRHIVIELPADFNFEMNGLQFLRDWSLPNFFFHVTTGYDILRHNGVPVGKQNFIGHAMGYARPKTAA